MREKIKMRGEMAMALEIIEKCSEFAFLIPEVRTNMVYSKPEPKTPEDVLGVDGRITVVNGMPRAAGRIKFGASDHMARLIIELNRRNSLIRAGINFSNNPTLANWLEEYCQRKDWIFSVINRSKEPDSVMKKEGKSMPWKVQEAIRFANNRIPKLFYETGAVGKEPVSVLVAEEPIKAAREVCKIAKLYKRG